MSKRLLPVPPAAALAAGVALGAVAVGAGAAAAACCLQLARTRSGMARVCVVRDESGEQVRVLQRGGVYQSATYLGERCFEPVFAYYRAFDAMFEAEDAMRARCGHGIGRVLMLGGGGFSYPKHALTTRSNLAMDVVEIDPSVVRLARRWFFLDELEARLRDPAHSRGNTLRIIESDGRSVLARVASAAAASDADAAPRYDAVVNDAFDGREPVRSLATVEAARLVRSCLVPGGLYLMNVVSAADGEDVGFLRAEVATLQQVFAHVWVLDATDDSFGGEDNYLLVASDGAYDFADAILFDAEFPTVPLCDNA